MANAKSKPAPSGGAGRKSNARPKPNATLKHNTTKRGAQPKITVKDFAVDYMAYCELYNAPKTLDGKRRYIRRLVAFFGATPLADVTRLDVERYVADRKPNAGVVTINRELRTFKHFFNYAGEHGHVEKNPVKGFRFFAEARKPLNVPGAAEVRTLLAWCRAVDPRTGKPNDMLIHDLVTLAANTGLRRGDVLKIRGEDVDFDRRLLKVAVSKTGKALYIPLNDAALAVLARLNRPGYLFHKRTPTNTLRNEHGRFAKGYCGNPNGNGAPPLNNFRKRFNNAKRAAGVEFRYHDLRHAFAYAVLDAGANIRTLQVLLDHSRLTTTERYLKVSDPQKQAAVATLKW